MRQQKSSDVTLSMARAAALALLVSAAFSATAIGGPLILNEYNAVASNKYLADGQYSGATDKEDLHFKRVLDLADDGLLNDSNNGRVEGNGGNWLELVVVEDHLDVRGWELRWAEPGATDTDGSDVWYGDSGAEQGIITFASNSVWSDLRAGTIITISEKAEIGVDTDWDDVDRNFTDGVAAGDVDAIIPLAADLSFAPASGDWWIHVSTRGELGELEPLVTTVTNVNGDAAGDFSVGADDWELTIVDGGKGIVYGPVGEDISGWGGGGLNDREAGRLEAPPTNEVWDLDDWDSADFLDYYDDSTSTTFGGLNEWGGEFQDLSALRAQIPEPATWVLLVSGGLALMVIRVRRRRAA